MPDAGTVVGVSAKMQRRSGSGPGKLQGAPLVERGSTTEEAVAVWSGDVWVGFSSRSNKYPFCGGI
jgi:hypothetical protein